MRNFQYFPGLPQTRFLEGKTLYFKSAFELKINTQVSLKQIGTMFALVS